MTVPFCQRLMTDTRETLMVQLQLLRLARTEEEPVPIEVTGRAELVELMARILVTVFQTERRRTDERASIQPQDHAGTSGA